MNRSAQHRGNVESHPGGVHPARGSRSQPWAPSDHWPWGILWACLPSSHFVTSGHGVSEHLEQPFFRDPRRAVTPVLSFLPPQAQPSTLGPTYHPGSSPRNPKPASGQHGGRGP